MTDATKKYLSAFDEKCRAKGMIGPIEIRAYGRRGIGKTVLLDAFDRYVSTVGGEHIKTSEHDRIYYLPSFSRVHIDIFRPLDDAEIIQNYRNGTKDKFLLPLIIGLSGVSGALLYALIKASIGF